MGTPAKKRGRGEEGKRGRGEEGTIDRATDDYL
jgi:hypothetical protein